MRVGSWKVLAAAMLMVLGASLQAQALTITPGSEVLSGDETAQSEIDVILANYFASIGADVDLLYKNDEGGSDSGPFANSYKTEYFNTPTDPEDARISWKGNPFPFINSGTTYLLVKDGNASPAWYLFNISGWDGKETIDANDFWPGRGAISHVTIYGGLASVPDGGSMAMLLGMALLGLAGARRMLS